MPPNLSRTRSDLCETHAEELAGAITHAVGLLLSIIALIVMLKISIGDPWRTIGGAVFGSTLVLLYLSSTLYHSFSGPRTKSALQIIDHSAIYLLIAGTYTPLALVTLHGPWGWTLLTIVWTMALCGVIIKSVMRKNREHWISTALYIFMGWLVVVALGPLIKAMPTGGLVLLVSGGLCYTGGVAFFAWQKLKYNHAIWHLFVLAGSICHALMVILHVLS
ncbi:hemolysin III family protein [Luteolibacter algae]|uniref:Hemolysin III family protein n=1 Tax=Luteolibacter algae TaxID=454151 RepID=A0ABW5D4Y3_9BACT